MKRSRIARLVAELGAAQRPREGEEALAQLSVRQGVSDAALVALVGGGLAPGKPALEIRADTPGATQPGRRLLAELADDEAAVVSLARDVYTRIPTREGRVKLLRAARYAATEAVVVHVPVGDENSHLARAVVDAPRKALRAARLPLAEPGDRFGPDHYAHCFFDEEALLGELAAGGLAVERRRGFTFVLRATDPGQAPAPEDADAFTVELVRVARLVPAVELARTRETPQRALAAMRVRAAKRPARGPIGRARLRRAIGWLDALGPGGPSCYRRILLEVALDRGAARETVVFGLDVGKTGHVAFQDREERTFDVSFAIPPE